MPKAVTVLSSRPLPLAEIAEAITASGASAHLDDKHVGASGKWGQFLLYEDGMSKLEHFEELQPLIVMRLAHPVFAVLEYSTEVSLSVALGFLPRNVVTLIADDFGVALPLDQYVSRLQASLALRG